MPACRQFLASHGMLFAWDLRGGDAMRWMYYVVAALATAAACWLWLFVIAGGPSRAPVSSAAVAVPEILVARQTARINDAIEGFKQTQLARAQKIRDDNLRRHGLLPPRPLRAGESCVGGTVVGFSTVGGVPTYTQVLEQGYRVSCAQ